MEVKEIQSKKTWENFLLECEEKTFLNSWNWGEFNKMMEEKIWRLGIYDNEELVLVALVVKIVAKRGTFLLVQHGPLGKKEVFNIFFEELKKIAKEEKASFIRIVPLWERNRENKKFLQNLRFREAPMHANAYEATLKLGLSASEEELLKNMRKTTRYLIRQAQKNPELEVIKSDNREDIELYEKLNQAVAKHQQFVPFSFEFIKNEFDIFSKDGQALMFFGKYQGEIIASALIVFWSKIGFYHQAALLPKYHKIPVSYLLQWEAIKEAKKRGCILYDFWGYVNPFENPKHPWAGPTLFKMGFGGKPYEYVKTQDFPLSKRYWLTFIFEKIRKAKRGL